MKRAALILLFVLSLAVASCEDDCNCRPGSMHYGTRINTWTGDWEYCECE